MNGFKIQDETCIPEGATSRDDHAVLSSIWASECCCCFTVQITSSGAE